MNYRNWLATLLAGVALASTSLGADVPTRRRAALREPLELIRDQEARCATELPFDRAPLEYPIERYSGAAWLSWSTGSATGAIISEDDHGRAAKGFRNRWRYTFTGPAAVGLPLGCSARWVRVRVLPGGTLTVDFDAVLHLVIVPGDPDLQVRFGGNAGVCEANLQLVDVANVEGRWRIMIEEPVSMPESRSSC